MSAPGSTARAPIRFGRLKPLLTVLGIPRRNSYLDVGAERARVRMGWAFRADVTRASIRHPQAAGAARSIGVHGWRDRWLANGA